MGHVHIHIAVYVQRRFCCICAAWVRGCALCGLVRFLRGASSLAREACALFLVVVSLVK